MAEQLWSGRLNDFGDSMAREIEIALDEARAEMGLPPLPTPPHPNDFGAVETVERNHRRVLFIAIARGVLRHLQKNPEAFDITVKVAQHPPVLVHPVIDVRTP